MFPIKAFIDHPEDFKQPVLKNYANDKQFPKRQSDSASSPLPYRLMLSYMNAKYDYFTYKLKCFF